jgi:hypothetical protein
MNNSPYSLETIGRWARIIDAKGNDVLFLGDVHEPDTQQRADELLPMCNLLARLRQLSKDATSLRDQHQWTFERTARGKPPAPEFSYAVEWHSRQVSALCGYLITRGFDERYKG